MCCSANPDAPAEPAPLPRSRSGVPLHGRPAGASSDRDRRDPTREPCGMWRTWRRHETDTKFFDTKSDREPSYHGRAHTDMTQRAAPHPRRVLPTRAPRWRRARWCLPARPGAVRDVPLMCLLYDPRSMVPATTTSAWASQVPSSSHPSSLAAKSTLAYASACRSRGPRRWPTFLLYLYRK